MILLQIISYGISAFTAGLFAFFLLTSGKTDRLSRSFSVTSSCVAVWATFLLFWHLSEDGNSALLLLRLGIVFSLLIPASFFSFTTYFAESVARVSYSRHRIAIYIVGVFFALLVTSDILSFTSIMVPSVSHKLWFPYWPNAGPIYKYALVYFFGAFSAGFYLLLKLIKGTQDKILKGQLKFVLGGAMVAMLGGSTNYFLWYDVPIPPFGVILVPIYVISMFYAIARYQLFNIKVITAQLVTFTIWLFLLFRIFFSRTNKEFAADVALLLLVIFFGIFLIKSVLNEVKRKGQLQIITAELKNLTGHLQEKVDEQTKEIRRSYEVEKKARVELEELGAAKDQFILSAQGSLIAPLKTMNQSIDELKRLALPHEAMEDVTKVAYSTERLSGLVDEFVSISKIRIGKGTLKMERADLLSIINDILHDLSPQIKEKRIKTSLVFPSKTEDNVLNMDKGKMKEALANLLDNAVKYNKEDGEIRIKGEKTHHPIERDKLVYRLAIEDTGIGMSSEDLLKVFARYFERGKEAEKIYTTGKGIGLAVTKNIIEAHNGRIYAESEGKGNGSKFVMELLLE